MIGAKLAEPRRRFILFLFAVGAVIASAPGTLAGAQLNAGAAVSIAVTNAGFEEGRPGEAPPRWHGTTQPTGNTPSSGHYAARIDPDTPRSGRASVRLEHVAPTPDPQQFGTVTSSVDATSYRGQRVRLRAHVRTDAPESSHVGLWLRIDREQRRRGFFDNMGDRPIRSADWSEYSIEGDVAPDAERLVFGLLLAGTGRAWMDEVRLEVIGPSRRSLSPAAAASEYLDQAIDLLRRHHINSAGADWDRIIAQAWTEIGGASEPGETHDAIRGILYTLGETHSFLRPPMPQPRASGSEPRQWPPTPPQYALVDARFGLVRLPGFAGTADEAAIYSSRIQTGLNSLDEIGVCGWIVDLRGNAGGNMWPMLNGIEPLLGPSPFGSFQTPSGAVTYWTRQGRVVIEAAEARSQPPVLRLRHASRPVAVLLDSRTASSGEMVAVALIGRSGVRTFGAPTAGFATANQSFPLADGAFLVVTTALVRDRTGQEYRGAITPAERIEASAAAQAARQWLATLPCRAG